jgi:hypothetical protein
MAASSSQETQEQPLSTVTTISPDDRFSTWPLPGQTAEPDTPVAEISARSEPIVLVPKTEVDEEMDDLGIEDAVIRELARSVQPQWG